MTFTGETVELHGHRGARGLRPENTLPAFRHALALGVHAIEFDVGLTSDDVVVLHHDQALSRVTTRDTGPAAHVGRPLRELTLAEVRTMDASTRRPAQDDDPFVLTQLPVPGTSIPTLAEVCALLSTVPKVQLAVELKTDPSWPDAEITRFTAAVAEVLHAFGVAARSRLLAFDWRVLVEARRYVPEAGRVALIERATTVPGTRWFAGLDPVDPVAAALDIGATSLSPEMAMTTPALVEHAHALALPVSVWTVNEPADMARYISYDVNAIVTDYPDRLRTVLKAHNLPLPTPWPTAIPVPN